MDWLADAFLNPTIIQAIVVISIVSAIGLSLGRVKIFGISLGITFVFFAGILAGHIGIVVNQDMLTFAQNFGLIIFVYTLGVQVGPGFFSSFKKGGIQLNMLALGLILLGSVLAITFHWTSGIPLYEMMGLFSGAVTNTPALGAAQQAFLQLNPGDIQGTTDMALACAVTYPLGVMGVIMAIVFLRKFLTRKKDYSFANEHKDPTTYVAEFQVRNPAIYGKCIRDIMKLTPKQFVISRVWRDGKVTIPTSETTLQEKDHLLIITVKSDLESIKVLFGEQEEVDWNKENIDWNAIDSQLISRRVMVTREKINGVKLGSLRLRNLYGINITRINRAGIDLLASPDLHLQIGDRLTIVGEANSINNVVKILGNEVKQLDNPNLIAIFIGISMGVILGAVPISLPGISVPVKLGIAGGPIIVGILMGAFGPRLHLTTYTTQSANLMLRQLGIVLYLAGLGISSGAHFFETVFRAEGLVWIGLGAALTLIPVLIVGIVAMQILKKDYATCVGMLCGSMANPMALTYANSTVEGDEPSVAYATVYPLSMFIRVILAQLIVLLFS